MKFLFKKSYSPWLVVGISTSTTMMVDGKIVASILLFIFFAIIQTFIDYNVNKLSTSSTRE